MTGLAIGLLALPAVLFGYAYFAYPALLWAGGRLGRSALAGAPPEEAGDETDGLPGVSVILPVHDEERSVGAAVERLLALETGGAPLEIVVVSDASADRTDDIVASYADRGVKLLRLPERAGKTAAENLAASRVEGEIVVTTDATTRIPPGSLRPLIRAFRDPGVGVASGRDVSVPAGDGRENFEESGYVGYEMWIRDLETRTGGIVGASGCFYAMRGGLHRVPFPERLSRDFGSCLVAREHGFRAVSVTDAVCFVPRTDSLAREYRRKVRTMTRGLATLTYKRHLLNPVRHGIFAWKLASHKLARWLAPVSLIGLPAGLLLLALDGWRPAFAAIGLMLLAGLAGGLAWRSALGGTASRLVSTLGWAVAANVAALAGWFRFFRGGAQAFWEPTRR